MQLGQRDAVIGQMLDHVGRQDEIERAVLERHPLDRRLRDIVDPACGAELDRVGRDLGALDGAQHAKLEQVAARAAARVQYPQRRADAGSRQQRPDHRSPAPEPPMLVFELELLTVGLLLQGARL